MASRDVDRVKVSTGVSTVAKPNNGKDAVDTVHPVDKIHTFWNDNVYEETAKGDARPL